MKIQISPEKKIDDAMVIWPYKKNDVDLVLDPRPPYGLKFKKGSIKTIYAFGILGITKEKEIIETLKSFIEILEPKGELYIIEQDLDYILRSMLGGDLSVEEFNKHYRKETYLNQDEIVKYLEKVGFPVDKQVWWQESNKFIKKSSEIIISAVKNNNQ